MEFAKLGRLRLRGIYNLIHGELPVAAGLGIEKQCKNSESYYVIAFVKIEDGEPNIEVIGDRILDIDKSEWEDFQFLAKRAIDMIRNQLDFEREDY